jgi:hypothetical protein
MLVGLVVSHAYVVLSMSSPPVTVLGASNAVDVTLVAGAPQLVINEVDYDQPGNDTGEYVEIYNAGSAAADLAMVVLELVNGSGDAVYGTFNLSDAGASLPAGGYLVVGTTSVTASLPMGTLSIDFANADNNVQNGAPDGLRISDTTGILDQMSYEGDMSTTEGTGAGADDNVTLDFGLSRLPNGADTDDNSVDFVFTTSTPGAENVAPPVPTGVLVINEVDYDQPGTDSAEFVEIFNAGAGPADLTNVVLELVNGSDDGVYDSFQLIDAGASLAAGEYLVVGSSSVTASLPMGTLSLVLSSIQNGAPDGIRLLDGATVLDQMSYEGDMSTTEGTGAGADDGSGVDQGLSRLPNGTDTDDNSADFVLTTTTPGAQNASPPSAAQLVINEVDYDQPSTDFDEFVEIYNAGASAADLTNVVLELVNGSGDVVYGSIALSAAGASLPAGEYLVVGSSTVVSALPGGTLSVTFGAASNNVQNGAPDGVRLRDGLATLDQMSYEGAMSTTEGTTAGADDGANAGESLQRFPNGSDTDDNSVDFSVGPSSPGAQNDIT